MRFTAIATPSLSNYCEFTVCHAFQAACEYYYYYYY